MGIEVRTATAADRPAVNALLRRVLNVGNEPRYDRFLEWKHLENPFGASYEWVATAGSTTIGYRSFLRWEFVVRGEVFRAVRAVDTATDSEYRGQGVFTALTTHAIDELRHDGVAWIFNTPNPISEAGYLKMGWSVVGAIPVSVSARNPLVVRHLRRSRPPAKRWSERVDEFEPAVAAIERIASSSVPSEGYDWATNRTAEFLRWRYGLDDLHYRGVPAGDGGVVVFRVRRRGAMREAVIVDLIGGARGARVSRSDVRRILRATRADVAIVGGAIRPRRALSISGPRLVWRPVDDERIPTLDQLALRGGDVELF